MKHYVYRIEDKNTGEFYYGSRTFDGNIKNDTYMGSMVTWNPNKDDLIKIIINDDFSTRKDANEYEIKLITENIDNKLNRNYNIPPVRFCTQGKKWSEEWKIEQKKRMEEYYKTHPYSNEGKTFSKEWRTNISKARIELGTAKGSNNGNSYGNVKITDLSGKELIFDTPKEASIKLKTDRFTLTQHCKNETTYQRGKLKGWKFEIL